METNPNTEPDGDEDDDDLEITEEEFARARPFAEVFPELAEKMRRAAKDSDINGSSPLPQR